MNSSKTGTHRSVFTLGSSQERSDNFEDYWRFALAHSGELLEETKDLTIKRDLLKAFQAKPVKLNKPFNPDAFNRNYRKLIDDPTTLDKKSLLLSCIYKFARHEWEGISGAWDATPPFAQCQTLTDKISRHHLAEEFCHVRFFNEMFRAFGINDVEWTPLGPVKGFVYRTFPKFPENLMSPFAFVTELMGIVFYLETDAILDEVFGDEPEARDRIRALLNEITVDEVAHVGQRRNYIGSFGMQASKWMLPVLFKLFFADIPETKHFFDIDKMIQKGLEFDYNEVPAGLLSRSWIPSYCV